MFDVMLLLVLFQLKHFICDYPLQGTYMLGKFKEEGWQIPLFCHAAVHYLGTFTVIMLYDWLTFTDLSDTAPGAMLLALVDLVVHFGVDRLKASPKLLGRWPTTSRYFWWALGFDQMLHHLTHYAIIWVVLS
jgi:uncharacterized membrane protein